MSQLHKIAAAMGGEVVGDQARFPTPGHSAKDRGSTATLSADAPDGVIVHSFNGGNPLAIKDELRAKGALTERAAVQRARDVGAWEYLDASGKVAYRKVRTDKPDGSKTFRYEHPDGCGGWLQKRGGAKPVPYRLPDLMAAPADATVYLVEGERHADKLASWGFVATSSKDWRADFAAFIGNRRVVVLPDNDDEGRRIAADVMEKLPGAVALELPGLPSKGDIMDWRGDADALRRLVDIALTALAAPAPIAKSTHRPLHLNGISASALVAKTFNPIRYIVTGYIAEGATLFGGAPKIGKSWFMLGVALAVAGGRPAFGSIACEHGDVLYLALEDNERRLKKRLLHMNQGTPERLTFMTDWPTMDEGAIDQLEAWVASVERPRLIVVDVLTKVRGGTRNNESAYEADYRALTGLQGLAGRHGLAIVIVHHTRKMDADDPFDSVSGTRGLTGAADTVLVLKRDLGTGAGGRVTLYGRGRDIEEIETAFEFNRDNGTWRVVGAAHEVARTCERQAILDCLRGAANPLNAREVSDLIGKSYGAVRKTLTRMSQTGEVEKSGRGQYTCPNGPNVSTYPIHHPVCDVETHGTGDEWGEDIGDPRTWNDAP